jgi:hypothetical protein
LRHTSLAAHGTNTNLTPNDHQKKDEHVDTLSVLSGMIRISAPLTVFRIHNHDGRTDKNVADSDKDDRRQE